jgi:sucrose-phosphate synthase
MTLDVGLAASRRVLVCDVDGTLVLGWPTAGGGQPGLAELSYLLSTRGDRFVFAVATGRTFSSVRAIFAEHHLPAPDILIASVGTSIHRGLDDSAGDASWQSYIDVDWDRDEVSCLAERVPGLRLQPPANQGPYKVSFDVEPASFRVLALQEAAGGLRSKVNVIITQSMFVDAVPERASKGRALRYFCRQSGIDLGQTLACGDSGNDRDLLLIAGRAVVVANYALEIEDLRHTPHVFFSAHPGAAGILDGMARHRFG